MVAPTAQTGRLDNSGVVDRDWRYSSTELAAMLRDQILTGQLPPGSLFPSDRWLCETHGVGRSLVRAAVAVLRSEGLVVTRQGQDTRVRKVHPKRPIDMTNVVKVETRMPTAPEREAMLDSPEDGVPVWVVWRTGDTQPTLLPGDRWMVPGPASSSSEG